MKFKLKIKGFSNNISQINLNMLKNNLAFKFSTLNKYPKSKFVTKKLNLSTYIPTLIILGIIPTVSVWYTTNSVKTNSKMNKFINNYIFLGTIFQVSSIKLIT